MFTYLWQISFFVYISGIKTCTLKAKKITVKFKNIRFSKYCHITYNRRTSKFVYFLQEETNEIIEAKYVENCVRFLIDRNLYPPYFIKISELINVEFNRSLDAILPDNIGINIGDILTHNQFEYLCRNCSHSVHYLNLREIFDVTRHSKMKIKSLNLNFDDFIHELSFDSKMELFISTLIYLFERPSSFRLINYLVESEDMIDKLKRFMNENKSEILKFSFLDSNNFEPSISDVSDYIMHYIDEYINDRFV